MNYCPFVALCAIFLLVVQTVAFGIWGRACEFGLDFPSQFRHNSRIVNYQGYYDAERYCNTSSRNDAELRLC